MAEDISIIRYEELPRNEDFLQQRVAFTFGRRSNTVAGILKLVQMIVKMLLTTPGTDHFAVSTGTILLGLFKRGVSKSSVALLTMDIMISIQDMERQILDIQAGLPTPDDERLKEIRIISVQYLEVSGEWQVQISVLSEGGEQVAFDIAPYLKGK
jgi:hypothetical protein